MSIKDEIYIERSKDTMRIEASIMHEQARLQRDADIAYKELYADIIADEIAEIRDMYARNAWKALYSMARTQKYAIIFAPFLNLPIKVTSGGATFGFFAANVDGLIAAKQWIEGDIKCKLILEDLPF